MRRAHSSLWIGLLLVLAACSEPDGPAGASPDAPDAPLEDTTDSADDADGDLSDVEADVPDAEVGPMGPTRVMLAGDGFFDRPWPSDLRSLDGRPDLTAFPNPLALPLLTDLVATAMDHGGAPQTPVAYFRFTAPLAPRSPDEVVVAGPEAPFLLVRVDTGETLPVIAQTLDADPHVPENVLAVGPRPGMVLPPNTQWAFVVRASALDAEGDPLDTEDPGVPAEHALWQWVDRTQAAAATVFTTGDEAQRLSDLVDAALQEHDPAVGEVALDERHDRFCELSTSIRLPQFQKGEPPYDTEGLFADGSPPPAQREEVVPITLTVPVGDAPEGGWPLIIYFHGSGGLSSQVVDRGPVLEEGGERTPGRGPAFALSPYGFATAGPALPVNPQRSPGAGRLGYINLANLASYRDTVRQGVIEHRMILRALRSLDAETPCGRVGFNPRGVGVMGQSQGAFYATIFTALEPLAGATAPTGSGGHWSQQLLLNQNSPLKPLVAALLQTPEETLTHLHPVLHVLQTAWEVVDPIIYAPRIVRDPLPGRPQAAVYQPVAPGDTFYPTPVFDAMALAYGHRQAGEEVWPSMQEALALRGLDGLLAYPVGDHLSPGTSVVVQYEGDGLADPHGIFAQLDAVKTQYACFFWTWWRGQAQVVDPAIGCLE